MTTVVLYWKNLSERELVEEGRKMERSWWVYRTQLCAEITSLVLQTNIGEKLVG